MSVAATAMSISTAITATPQMFLQVLILLELLELLAWEGAT